MREGSGRAVRRRLARRSFRPAPPVRVEAQFAARAQVAVRRGGGGGESEEERGGREEWRGLPGWKGPPSPAPHHGLMDSYGQLPEGAERDAG
ncbi:unnamed protein product [Prorocentrum cordatum]|uniref:Uncharacterized protein n=1 Tax=Prorocentrum cordatum TaxID=2364126 RepID=A0ABN9QNC6_9DINO|nr:unnamed protein product [Polarella glacialis]